MVKGELYPSLCLKTIFQEESPFLVAGNIGAGNLDSQAPLLKDLHNLWTSDTDTH